MESRNRKTVGVPAIEDARPGDTRRSWREECDIAAGALNSSARPCSNRLRPARSKCNNSIVNSWGWVGRCAGDLARTLPGIWLLPRPA